MLRVEVLNIEPALKQAVLLCLVGSRYDMLMAMAPKW
jgi:hypothetical protein